MVGLASLILRPNYSKLGTLGATFLRLPVVVAGARLLVAVGARRHAQARGAALLAEEQAWLLVRRRRAPELALVIAFCNDHPQVVTPPATGPHQHKHNG